MSDNEILNSQTDESGQREFKEPSKFKTVFLRFFILLLILGVVVLGGSLFLKTSFTFSKMSVEKNNNLLPDIGEVKKKDPNRVNILLLGLRGEKDPHGGLLTDTIILVSIHKTLGKAALISIPRDLYVQMPDNSGRQKINFAHALGEEKKRGYGGLIYAKAVAEKVLEQYIDGAISVNFSAFEEVVDILGGIDIELDRPFVENQQFTNEIILNLPKGPNHLDGERALFFARSRFTTSDFDRMRRQQLVILAIKDKALSLNILANPVKIFNLLDSFGNNIKTTLSITQIKELINLSFSIDQEKIIQKVFDTSEGGLLYSEMIDGGYYLLPAGGNFSKIQETINNIFNEP